MGLTTIMGARKDANKGLDRAGSARKGVARVSARVCVGMGSKWARRYATREPKKDALTVRK